MSVSLSDTAVLLYFFLYNAFKGLETQVLEGGREKEKNEILLLGTIQ